MASVNFDRSTGWWRCSYFAGPGQGRKIKSLCKHPGSWSKARPPKKPPPEVEELARPYREVERRARAGEAPPPMGLTLADYLNDYLAALRDRTDRPNTLRSVVPACEAFAAWCKERGAVELRHVSPRICSGWLEHERARGLALKTIRTRRAYLRAAFERARKRLRLIAENPWDAATIEGKADEAVILYWTTDELPRLLSALRGWHRDAATLAVNAGLRVTALLMLQWRDVDLARETVTIRARPGAKVRRPYTVPLTPSAAAMLAKRWATADDTGPDALVFPGQIPGRPMQRQVLYTAIKSAVKRSGVRDLGHYCHALRHSCAVALVDQDVPLAVIQGILGHAQVSTTMLYARLRPEKAASLMRGLNIEAGD